MSKTSLRQKFFLLVFGLLLTVLLLEGGLRLAGFLFVARQDIVNRQDLVRSGVYRILCVGESTTALGGPSSYPSQLEAILNRRSPQTKFKVLNKGLPGTNSGRIAKALPMYLDIYKPDMVVAMIGINEDETPGRLAWQGNSRHPLRHWRVWKLTHLLMSHIRHRERTARVKAEEISLAAQIDAAQDFHQLVRLGDRYRQQEKYPLAIAALKRALLLNPGDTFAYLLLGRSYREAGRFHEAEEAFQNAVASSPQDYKPYGELGDFYRSMAEVHADSRYDKLASEMFAKCVQLRPNDNEYFLLIAWFYRHLQDYPQMVAFMQRHAKRHPNAVPVLSELVEAYRLNKQYQEAEATLTRMKALNPGWSNTYVQWGWIYHDQGQPEKAQAMFAKALSVSPKNHRVVRSLGRYYQEQNNAVLAAKYFQQAARIKGQSYNPELRENYQKIKDTVRAHGIKLISVQYPLRSVEPLKRLLAPAEGVVFVDNERIFKAALQTYSYPELFLDRSAGDFGHATRQGNRILAQNVADAIEPAMTRD